MAELGIAEEIVRAVHRALVTIGFHAEQGLGGDPIVPGTVADAMLDRDADQLHDDAIALTVASLIPIGALGVVDYAMCASATLRDALHQVASHYHLGTQRVNLELVSDGPLTQLVFHRASAGTRHWVEFGPAMIATRVRQTLPVDVALAHVAFAHPAPPDTRRYSAFFTTPVQFGSSHDALSLRSDLLDRELVTAQPAMAELLELKLRELKSACAVADPLVERAQRALATMLDFGATDIGELANRLGISTRTLQRGLAHANTSHSALLDQLRCERASLMLKNGLRVSDIAKRLGFAAPSGFFRAYRRWTGTSPKRRPPR
jgi:AraC-like DNA-binding protein